VGILINAAVFTMLPSCIMGISELVNVPLFKTIGPFYMLSLAVTGVNSSFIYIALYPELQKAAKLIFMKTIKTNMPTL
jgi:molybdopterin biosynthesis enzyme MoaB